jgi:UDP-3-O-[3-hydroxymyristoyl] glucosamine N-acyltransferase
VAWTIRSLAEKVDGQIHGDETITVNSARPVREALPGDITYVEAEKYLTAYLKSAASVAVVPKGMKLPEDRTFIVVVDPLLAFSIIFQEMHEVPTSKKLGIHPKADIHPSAKIGEAVYIGPYVTIGEGSVIGDETEIHSNVSIGDHCELASKVTIYSGAVLYSRTKLGHRVIIHSNAVIGADGFGYRTIQGKHVKVPQLGNVELGDDVEIGAGTTIDRGTFGTTRIGQGTKIDNMVMIGHNCQIGKHNLLVSQVGIAGSVTTGDYVVMAGQVGIADHITIGDRTMLGAKAGVHRDIAADQRMIGVPATPDREQYRIVMALEKLPELRKDVQRMKKKLGMDEE